MVSASVHSEEFDKALLRFRDYTGKTLSEVVKEQAKLLARRLSDLTPPKNQAQGKKRVAIDVGKVFLKSEWFESIFHFQNQKLGDRIKEDVRRQDEDALRQIFENSQKLNRIHIEPFDPGKHAQARNSRGRVNYPAPFSFPLSGQGEIKAYEKQKQSNVGIAKSGWAACLKALGGSAAAWLSKLNTGSVEDNSADAENPSITLINHVSYFADINERQSIVERALEGRARDMIRAGQIAVEKAQKKAGL